MGSNRFSFSVQTVPSNVCVHLSRTSQQLHYCNCRNFVMKAQFIPKNWFGVASVWALGRRPNITYSPVKEQETSTLPSPSKYQDDDIEITAEQVPTYQKSRSRASLFAIIVLGIIVLIQSFMLFAQKSTHYGPSSPIPKCL